MQYPGGKNNRGTLSKIINLIPPHRQYFEVFLGSGAVMRHKRPAQMASYGIDTDKKVIEGAKEWKSQIPGLELAVNDAARVLKLINISQEDFIYCDPPYLPETRSKPKMYRHEMTREQHIELLSILRELPSMIMISGYWSQLYAEMLHDWHTHHFPAVTRGGTVKEEWLWMNYPEPIELHDYRFLGDNYRKREQIKRQKQRWIKKLKSMPITRRRALMWAIEEAFQEKK